MGKLVRLELYNFKSYKGHHVLLFGDAFFTSIIGPNGSGKSNAMDAISFVLGIKSSHLRSAHLRELVYRGRVLRTSKVNGEPDTNGVNGHHDEANDEVNGTQERHDPKSAWVMAVYDDEAGEEQKWKRTITNQGASEYRVNERVVTAVQYNQSLENENILIKARNFLVFQGDVEAIAIQKPQDLTRLIEQVSGSLEYKQEYDDLKAQAEEAAEKQNFQLNRRRGINAEIKQYQEQKREMDNYLRKVEERDEAVVTHVLWKVYHLQRQIEEATAEIQKHQNELKEYRRGVEKYERELEVAKKEYADKGRQVTKAERAIKDKDKEIEEMANSLIPVDEQIQVATKHLTKYSNRINEIARERETQNAAIKPLEKELKVIRKAEDQWKAEWDARKDKQGGQLSDADLKQYNKLREEVNEQTSSNQIRVDNLKRQRVADEGTVNSLKSKVEGAEFQLRALAGDYNGLADRKNALGEIVEQTQKEIDAKKKDVGATISKRIQTEQKRTELNEKLQKILRNLQDANDGRQQTEREARIKEVTQTLKRTFPGIRGRVSELCKPKQKKFAEAVSTVLGKNFDAVVLDHESTAKQCMEYLRDQRLPEMSFIPLDTVQVEAPRSHLMGMHGGMRPAIETVGDYDAAVARAIQYACGNTIVCDDLDIAKHLCYQRNVGVKAVTLDGSVLHKGGLMTGGRGREQQDRRWDSSEVDKWTLSKDKYLAEIQALPDTRSQQVEESVLQGELAGLESKHRLAQEEFDALQRNLASKKKEVDHAKGQLKEVQPKYRAEQNKLEKLDEEIHEYQDSVNDIADKVFAGFCKQHNFDDIRDYEARQGSLQQEAAQKALEFKTQKSRIENQLGFEKSRLQATEARIQSIQDKEQRDQALIDELNERKEGIQNDLDSLNAELEDLGERLAEQKQAHQDAHEVLMKRKHEVQKRGKNVESTLKAINAGEVEMQKHSSARYALFRRCKIENIPLPLTEDSTTFDKLPMNDTADPEAMDVDEDEEAELHSSALHAPTRTDYGIEADFAHLDTDLKDEDSDAVDAELEQKIHALNATLDKMAPNMRATDRLASATDKFHNSEADFEAARKSYRSLKLRFDGVQQKRNDLFNKAFNHISEQIEPIYADLTKSTDFTTGGRAYLIADADEPYLSGINYHTMPPAKRFRDMEHLSGGEKTMAALALLFAVHSYQPSPFFVLDEVDAALDNANVAKLVNYVKDHAGPGMQFIVISLKTGFFQGSEALVGVYRDQGANSSKVLTLDLRRYQ